MNNFIHSKDYWDFQLLVENKDINLLKQIMIEEQLFYNNIIEICNRIFRRNIDTFKDISQDFISMFGLLSELNLDYSTIKDIPEKLHFFKDLLLSEFNPDLKIILQSSHINLNNILPLVKKSIARELLKHYGTQYVNYSKVRPVMLPIIKEDHKRNLQLKRKDLIVEYDKVLRQSVFKLPYNITIKIQKDAIRLNNWNYVLIYPKLPLVFNIKLLSNHLEYFIE